MPTGCSAVASYASQSMQTSNLKIAGMNTAFASSSSSSSSSAQILASSLAVNVINSGFLNVNLQSVQGISQIEYKFDNGSYSVSSTIQSFRIKLPTGSQTFRDYTRHTLTLRATDSYGYVSTSAAIPFTKGPNRDVNGDGFPDLAVGAYGYSSNNGRAYLFLSSSINGVAGLANTSANTIITGTVSGYLGASVSLGDINGDGYADLAIGAQNAGNGTVYIFYSTGAAGIIGSANDSAANRTITGVSAGDQFGINTTIADVNGDGYADLIGSSPAAATNAGKVHLFHSAGAAGISITTAASATATLTGTPTNAYFGNALATGDFNGDGFADLAIGGYASGTGGKAFIFNSAGATGIASGADTSATASLTTATATIQFSRGLAAGDFDGDGYMDLAVGAPVASASFGKVCIFRSTGTSGIQSASDTAAFNVISGTGGGQLGVSIAMGDVNADGLADLLAGAPTMNTNQGQAYLFISSGASGYGNINDVSANTIYLGTMANGMLGYALTLTDLNLDGLNDVVLGAYGVSTNIGAAYIFSSSGAAATAALSNTAANTTINGIGANEQFGLFVR